MKKISKYINFDVIYWITVVFVAFVEMKNSFVPDDSFYNYHFSGLKETLLIFLLFIGVIVAFILVAIFKLSILTWIYFGYKISKRKFYKDKLNKIDFSNDSYYRNIIINYSPAVLSYIDDFKLDEKDIVATIMSLDIKNKIKIDKNILIINENVDNLEKNEIYILDCLKSKSKNLFNIYKFKKIVIEDCLNKELLSRQSNLKKIIIKKIIFGILLYVLLINVFTLEFGINLFLDKLGYIGLIIFLVFGLIFVFYPFVLYVYIQHYITLNKINPYIRNKKAEKINKKIEGLKKYIKDFTLLDKNEYKHLALWKEYLIYSVFMGYNDNFVKKINEMININDKKNNIV